MPRTSKTKLFDNSQLYIPRRTVQAFDSLEKVRKAFSLPANASGLSHENRMAMDSSFDAAGGYSAIYESFQQHAAELGQYPLTSFIGYGALQQIAQQGLIRACVQTVADDMTRKWIEIKGGDDADKVEKLKELAETKYHLRQVFHKAFTTVGYMGGALIFVKVGFDNKTADMKLSFTDVSAELKLGEQLRFVVVDPVNCSPADYNCTDPLEEDYMQPKRWFVLGTTVDASRLIPIVDNEPPTLLKPNYNFLGIPQAQILWDYVMHFNDCRVSIARLLNKLSLLVVQTDMDAVLTDPNGVANFDTKMDLLARYRNNDAVFVCDKESEGVQNVQTSIAGCTDIVRQSLEMVAAINRTPAVKLLGISPSGFNATGESDITNYYDYIHSKQELHHDEIQKCLEAIQLVEFGFIDKHISFEFLPLSEEDISSKAMTANTEIGALSQLVDRQIISAEELREVIKQNDTLGLSQLSDEMPEMPDEQDEFMTDDPKQNLFGNLGSETNKQEPDNGQKGETVQSR
mgnify:FL=1